MTGWQDSTGKSPIAIQVRMRRARTYRMTSGKCFYCGGPLLHQGATGKRDWLFLRPGRHRMVQEHVTPRSRGGVDARENYVPSCAACNHAKGSFTIDEFRLLRGLACGNLSFRFAFEAPAAVPRDWLCCHSVNRQRDLVVHNRPSAADGYELRQRTRGILLEPRVRPVLP